MKQLSALFSGTLFGAGLIISGMSNPAKVLGFLDLAGHWDPSLAFVMAGAIAVATPAFAWARHRRQTLLNTTLHLPEKRRIDPSLIGGSLFFGAGWGLAGFCPGPALVAAAAGIPGALVFVAAMLGGMVIYLLAQNRKTGHRAIENDS